MEIRVSIEKTTTMANTNGKDRHTDKDFSLTTMGLKEVFIDASLKLYNV